MELDEVMRTTFSCRDFTDEAVPDDVIYRLIERARFAPSGGNRQGWSVIVVKDPATREAMKDIIAPTVGVYTEQVAAGEAPWNTIDPTSVDVDAAAKKPLNFPGVNELEKVPTLLVIGLDLKVVASFDSGLDRVGVISGASIYPFAWNILLAARSEGYGGTLTTYLAGQEARAQELLGMPSHVAVAGMLLMGRPVKQLTKLRRKQPEEFTRIDRWDGDAIATP